MFAIMLTGKRVRVFMFSKLDTIFIKLIKTKCDFLINIKNSSHYSDRNCVFSNVLKNTSYKTVTPPFTFTALKFCMD
jgi:hypothetical protein